MYNWWHCGSITNFDLDLLHLFILNPDYVVHNTTPSPSRQAWPSFCALKAVYNNMMYSDTVHSTEYTPSQA